MLQQVLPLSLTGAFLFLKINSVFNKTRSFNRMPKNPKLFTSMPRLLVNHNHCSKLKEIFESYQPNALQIFLRRNNSNFFPILQLQKILITKNKIVK